MGNRKDQIQGSGDTVNELSVVKISGGPAHLKMTMILSSSRSSSSSLASLFPAFSCNNYREIHIKFTFSECLEPGLVYRFLNKKK